MPAGDRLSLVSSRYRSLERQHTVCFVPCAADRACPHIGPKYISSRSRMLVDAWKRVRRLSIPVEVLVAGTFLFAIVVVLEAAKILPFYSSFLALLVSTLILGYTRRDAVEAFGGGFIIGYGGFLLGLPFSFLVQYARNPDAGLNGWLWSPFAGFVAAIFFGIVAAGL